MGQRALLVGGILLAVAGLLLLLRLPHDEGGRGNRGTADTPAWAEVPGLKGRPRTAEAVTTPTLPDTAEIDPVADVHGRVVDGDGRAIAGARVEAREQVGVYAGPPGAGALIADTQSARDGTFALRIGEGRVAGLRASAPDHGEGVLSPVRAGEKVELVLFADGRGARLAVRVVDEQGEGVAGADVVARQWREGRITGERRGTANDAGRVLLEGLPGGVVTLSVAHPEYPARSCTPWLREDAVAEVEVILESGRTVSGVVIDDADERPIPRAEVASGHPPRVATTDEEGRFSIDNVPPLLARVEARAPGYAPAGAYIPKDGKMAIRLRTTPDLVGRVVTAGGLPAAGAAVSARGMSNPGPGLVPVLARTETVADEDGRFRLRGLAPSVYAVTVGARGFGHRVLDVDPGGLPLVEGARDLGEVRLEEGARIEGRVLDDTGRPVAHCWVRATIADTSRPLRGRDAPYDRARFPAPLRSHTDHAGRFLLADLASGPWRLETEGRGAIPARAAVTLEPGDVAEVALTLRAGRSFGVRVLDPDGRPLPAAGVALSWTGDGAHARTDADGMAHFQGIPEEIVDVTIDVRPPPWPGERPFMQTVWTVAADRGGVTIPLRRVARLEGVVTRPDGTPLPHAHLRVGTQDPGAELGGLSGFADEQGRFSLTCAEGARVALAVTAHPNDTTGVDYDGALYRTLLYDVRPPKEDMVIVLDQVRLDATTHVQVLAPDGTPVAGTVVRAEGVRLSDEGLTDAAGWVRLEGLEGGVNHLSASPPPSEGPVRMLPLAYHPVDLRKKETYVLRLEPAREVTGVVLAADGSPVEGARVAGPHDVLRDALRPACTDAEGRFRLVVADETPLVLSAWWNAPDGTAWSARAEASPAGEVEFRLRRGAW